MQKPYGGYQANAYLAQRIDNASAEELAAMMLEGSERFLRQAMTAIQRNDNAEKGRMLDKTAKIMQRLLGMLNTDPAADQALVQRIHGIYIFWIKEMFEGSRTNRPEQIERVVTQMSMMRDAWTQVDARQKTSSTIAPMPPRLAVEGLVG